MTELPPEVLKRRTGATSRSEFVVVTLREMITRGDFPVGYHLQEIPLAESLGVSRTPIRSALNMLAQEGLLDPGPKRGYQVRGFSVQEILQAYEVRGGLEGTACRLLAERGLREGELKRLRELLYLGDRVLDHRDVGSEEHTSWSEINDELHGILMKSTENAMLQSLIQQIYRVPFAGPKHVHWYQFDEENYRLACIAHSHHHSIIDAIAKRQSARAEASMREHIYFSYGLIQGRFGTWHVGFDTQLGANDTKEK